MCDSLTESVPKNPFCRAKWTSPQNATRDLIKLKVLYELAHTFLNQAYEQENVLTRVVSGLQSGLNLVFIFTESFRLSPNRQLSRYAGMENRLIQF